VQRKRKGSGRRGVDAEVQRKGNGSGLSKERLMPKYNKRKKVVSRRERERRGVGAAKKGER
jgi:hypothetical protein